MLLDFCVGIPTAIAYLDQRYTDWWSSGTERRQWILLTHNNFAGIARWLKVTFHCWCVAFFVFFFSSECRKMWNNSTTTHWFIQWIYWRNLWKIIEIWRRMAMYVLEIIWKLIINPNLESIFRPPQRSLHGNNKDAKQQKKSADTVISPWKYMFRCTVYHSVLGSKCRW